MKLDRNGKLFSKLDVDADEAVSMEEFERCEMCIVMGGLVEVAEDAVQVYAGAEAHTGSHSAALVFAVGEHDDAAACVGGRRL